MIVDMIAVHMAGIKKIVWKNCYDYCFINFSKKIKKTKSRKISKVKKGKLSRFIPHKIVNGPV